MIASKTIDEQRISQAIARLDGFPRLSFGCRPTPLAEMPRLRAALGKNCPCLFIKRDDYTGFGFGGNKVRALEYLLAEAVREGVGAVVTSGGDRSNHARQTAAFCARLGLRCVLVLDRKPRPAKTEALKSANLFVSETCGAEVHLVDSIAERQALCRELVRRLQSDGLKVLELPLGGGLALGALGFADAMRELREQSDVAFDYLFTASSGACTQAGMLLGKQLFGFDGLKIIGVSPDEPSEDVRGAVRRMLGAASELLELAVAENVTVLTDYAGAGYCHETDAAQEALKLLARAEGIMLDSVYTAKAMAALLDWVRQGKLTVRDNVLFWHTGGQLGLFYA